MKKNVGLLGSLLLLATTYTTLVLMALEICDYGVANKLYTAFVKVGYLNLIALYLLWMGYRDKDNLTIGLVACSLLGMSWIVVDGFLIFEQVNLKGLAPCFGSYLEDGNYGDIVYFYGPYFLFFYLALTILLLYFYIVKLDITYQLKKFD